MAGVGALVTGGGGGFGTAIAERLAADGMVVTLMGRTESTLNAAREAVSEAVGRDCDVRVFVGDALLRSDVEEACALASNCPGGLGATVTVVGGGYVSPLLARTEDDLMEELRWNLAGSFLGIKYSVPHMVRRGGGSIVCISSDAAKLSFPFMIGYTTAKAGLEAMVRTAADELGHLKIRVNSVRPGLTQTNSVNSARLFSDEALIASFVAEKPLGRTGRPEDVANGVRYLVGPESSWVTGHSLAIEGGNELRRAPSLEAIARRRLGDDVVDRALAGEAIDQ